MILWTIVKQIVEYLNRLMNYDFNELAICYWVIIITRSQVRYEG